MKKMSKAEMKRLEGSGFFRDLREIVKAWDYYMKTGNKECSVIMMHQWLIAKQALLHITGNIYAFSRNGEGDYCLVNEKNHNDKILVGKNFYTET